MTRIPLPAIVAAAARAHKVAMREMVSHARSPIHTQARAAYYHVAVGLRGKQWSLIARALGHDHTSAMYGWHTGRRRHPNLKAVVPEIVRQLRERYPDARFDGIPEAPEPMERKVVKQEPKLKSHVTRNQAHNMRLPVIEMTLAEMQKRVDTSAAYDELASNAIIVLKDELQRRRRAYDARNAKARAVTAQNRAARLAAPQGGESTL